MGKYPIRILCMDKLFEEEPHLSIVDTASMMTLQRYPLTKTIGSLQEEWSEEHSIPVENQTVFSLQRRYHYPQEATMIDCNRVRLNPLHWCDLWSDTLLIDNRKIVI